MSERPKPQVLTPKPDYDPEKFKQQLEFMREEMNGGRDPAEPAPVDEDARD